LGLVYKGSPRAILGCFWLGHFRMLGKGAAAPNSAALGSDRPVQHSLTPARIPAPPHAGGPRQPGCFPHGTSRGSSEPARISSRRPAHVPLADARVSCPLAARYGGVPPARGGFRSGDDR